jgi:hypothetical protein
MVLVDSPQYQPGTLSAMRSGSVSLTASTQNMSFFGCNLFSIPSDYRTSHLCMIMHPAHMLLPLEVFIPSFS